MTVWYFIVYEKKCEAFNFLTAPKQKKGRRKIPFENAVSITRPRYVRAHAGWRQFQIPCCARVPCDQVYYLCVHVRYRIVVVVYLFLYSCIFGTAVVIPLAVDVFPLLVISFSAPLGSTVALVCGLGYPVSSLP